MAARSTVIVLNEIEINPERAKGSTVPGLQKEAALVAEDFRLLNRGIANFRGIHSHSENSSGSRYNLLKIKAVTEFSKCQDRLFKGSEVKTSHSQAVSPRERRSGFPVEVE